MESSAARKSAARRDEREDEREDEEDDEEEEEEEEEERESAVGVEATISSSSSSASALDRCGLRAAPVQHLPRAPGDAIVPASSRRRKQRGCVPRESIARGRERERESGGENELFLLKIETAGWNDFCSLLFCSFAFLHFLSSFSSSEKEKKERGFRVRSLSLSHARTPTLPSSGEHPSKQLACISDKVRPARLRRKAEREAKRERWTRACLSSSRNRGGFPNNLSLAVAGKGASALGSICAPKVARFYYVPFAPKACSRPSSRSTAIGRRRIGMKLKKKGDDVAILVFARSQFPLSFAPSAPASPNASGLSSLPSPPRGVHTIDRLEAHVTIFFFF